MPSLHQDPDRHTVLDRRPGEYLSFPDLLRLPLGGLVCAYREADAHVPKRRRLLLSRGDAQGRAWSAPEVLNPDTGHCPRFAEPAPGELVILDDAGRLAYRSPDQGRTWAAEPYKGMPPGIPDRALAADDGTWLSCTHRHEGEVNPAAGQRPAVQRIFASRDHGRTWEPRAVLGGDPNLVLCEGSMVRLPDGRILALMRENSQVFEPMYLCESLDCGRTWSAPRPTCLVGHRPTLGLTRSGKLLVTYRNRGPAGGTAAWMGDAGELEGFAVHGPAHHGPGPALTPGGLRLEPPDHGPGFYALRPLTHPAGAKASLKAVVMATPGRGGGGILRLGVTWLIQENRLTPLVREDEDLPACVRLSRGVPLAPGAFNSIRLEYDAGRLEVFVGGNSQAVLDLDPGSVLRRPVLFGAAPDGRGASVWREVRLSALEPGGQTPYVWEWKTALGLPDALARQRVLTLAEDHGAAWCDYGYSGWVETADGEFVCAYHHADAWDPEYRPGETSWVQVTRFSAEDFRP
ncbi:sialidase family protein [Desulfocurvus sp. DL9XJH121]